MKLLLDQNISYKLVKRLEILFPKSIHVNSLGFSTSDDFDIWQYARDRDFTIVTFDVNLSELSLVKGIPPKIIWLRCSNTITKNIEKLFVDNILSIKDFINNTESSCLQIY